MGQGGRVRRGEHVNEIRQEEESEDMSKEKGWGSLSLVVG